MKTPTHLYRERGALVEAMQLIGVLPDGTNIDEVFDWMREGNTPGKGLPVERHIDADDDLVVVIHSPDQTWTGRVGDWVVKHHNREFSVIGDDEFEASYEVVE